MQSSDLCRPSDKIKGRLCAAVAFDSVIKKRLSLMAMMYSPVEKMKCNYGGVVVKVL